VGPGQPFHTQHPAQGTGWDLQLWRGGILIAQIGP
jgi:hypothetical protein